MATTYTLSFPPPKILSHLYVYYSGRFELIGNIPTIDLCSPYTPPIQIDTDFSPITPTQVISDSELLYTPYTPNSSPDYITDPDLGFFFPANQFEINPDHLNSDGEISDPDYTPSTPNYTSSPASSPYYYSSN